MMRIGTVGLVGLPNHGKSTLLNALVGEKISAVSKRPQTTRQRVTGIWNHGSHQWLLLDLPGWVDRKDGLNGFLRQEFTRSLQDVDGVLWVVDGTLQDITELDGVRPLLVDTQENIAIVVTKSDMAEPSSELLGYLKGVSPHIVVGSAQTNPEKLRNDIDKTIEGWGFESAEPMYATDMMTLDSARTLAADMIREQCFEQLSQELPYQLAVQIRRFEEAPRLARIFAEILVPKESHKPIVIGEGGNRIKSIGTKARESIEQLIGQKVFLDLRVRVQADWMENKSWLEELGYG